LKEFLQVDGVPDAFRTWVNTGSARTLPQKTNPAFRWVSATCRIGTGRIVARPADFSAAQFEARRRFRGSAVSPHAILSSPAITIS